MSCNVMKPDKQIIVTGQGLSLLARLRPLFLVSFRHLKRNIYITAEGTKTGG